MSRGRRGRLVALEGIDGAGKSRLARAWIQALRRTGRRAAGWKEPTDPTLSAAAYACAGSDPWSSAVYFTLDRFLARPELERLLERAELVISDRSYYSTIAYQGSLLSQVLARRLRRLEESVAVEPDEVVLLRLPSAVALTRVNARRTVRNPFERRRTLDRVAGAYSKLAREGRWTVVDADRPARTVLRELMDWSERRLRRADRSAPRRS